LQQSGDVSVEQMLAVFQLKAPLQQKRAACWIMPPGQALAH